MASGTWLKLSRGKLVGGRATCCCLCPLRDYIIGALISWEVLAFPLILVTWGHWWRGKEVGTCLSSHHGNM